ncbi:MAG TPA: chemotaxis protein CheD [Cellvibrio sp.]
MIAVPEIKPLHSIHPGEWYFGTEYERLHTVLGSCVALTAWHPKLRLGGLCHYLLAKMPEQKLPGRDCRYAANALEQMKLAMMSFADPAEFELGVFGGGDMFAYSTTTSIGADNIQFARNWLMREKLKPAQVDVGGKISRSLTLIISTGEIQLKHYQMNAG